MGHLNELPKSGGQSSARRVMKGLQESGFSIIPIRRHRAELEGKLEHQLEIYTFAILDLIKIIIKIIFGSRRSSAFLHLTYAGPLVPYEFVITKVVKFFGYRSLIYHKGGQVLDYYNNGTERHRKLFKKTINLQEKVFLEGYESLKLVEGISDRPLVYFPNFLFSNQLALSLSDKYTGDIGIVYFGRIAPDKNIDIILDVFELLCKKRDDLKLTLIGGGGQSKSYVDMIDSRIENSFFKSRICRMGRTQYDTIMNILQSQHFYLFPSKEKAEGHSNSLNEAMGNGVIPIVSDYHFNRSVVGNDLLVVDGYDPKDYAERIEYIIQNCDMQQLAEEMRQRVVDYFSYEVVNARICEALRTL